MSSENFQDVEFPHRKVCKGLEVTSRSTTSDLGPTFRGGRGLKDNKVSIRASGGLRDTRTSPTVT